MGINLFSIKKAFPFLILSTYILLFNVVFKYFVLENVVIDK